MIFSLLSFSNRQKVGKDLRNWDGRLKKVANSFLKYCLSNCNDCNILVVGGEETTNIKSLILD